MEKPIKMIVVTLVVLVVCFVATCVGATKVDVPYIYSNGIVETVKTTIAEDGTTETIVNETTTTGDLGAVEETAIGANDTPTEDEVDNTDAAPTGVELVIIPVVIAGSALFITIKKEKR